MVVLEKSTAVSRYGGNRYGSGGGKCEVKTFCVDCTGRECEVEDRSRCGDGRRESWKE